MTESGVVVHFQGEGLAKTTEINGNPATGLGPMEHGTRQNFLDTRSSPLLGGTRESQGGRLAIMQAHREQQRQGQRREGGVGGHQRMPHPGSLF